MSSACRNTVDVNPADSCGLLELNHHVVLKAFQYEHLDRNRFLLISARGTKEGGYLLNMRGSPLLNGLFNTRNGTSDLRRMTLEADCFEHYRAISK